MTANELIRRHEGCRLTAYKDVGGVWTCGWGCTGPEVGEGTVWTQELADAELERRVAATERRVRELVTVPVTDEQIAALTSLAYNIGLTAFAGSRLLRYLNSGHSSMAADAFLAWDHCQGEVIEGLRNRRCAERAVFLGEEVS